MAMNIIMGIFCFLLFLAICTLAGCSSKSAEVEHERNTVLLGLYSELKRLNDKADKILEDKE